MRVRTQILREGVVGIDAKEDKLKFKRDSFIFIEEIYLLVSYKEVVLVLH